MRPASGAGAPTRTAVACRSRRSGAAALSPASWKKPPWSRSHAGPRERVHRALLGVERAQAVAAGIDVGPDLRDRRADEPRVVPPPEQPRRDPVVGPPPGPRGQREDRGVVAEPQRPARVARVDRGAEVLRGRRALRRGGRPRGRRRVLRRRTRPAPPRPRRARPPSRRDASARGRATTITTRRPIAGCVYPALRLADAEVRPQRHAVVAGDLALAAQQRGDDRQRLRALPRSSCIAEHPTKMVSFSAWTQTEYAITSACAITTSTPSPRTDALVISRSTNGGANTSNNALTARKNSRGRGASFSGSGPSSDMSPTITALPAAGPPALDDVPIRDATTRRARLRGLLGHRDPPPFALRLAPCRSSTPSGCASRSTSTGSTRAAARSGSTATSGPAGSAPAARRGRSSRCRLSKPPLRGASSRSRLS